MSDAIDKLWKEVWKRWSKSNSIERFPWADKKLLKEHPELEERIFNALTKENRFLVSRCLAALESINSAKLSVLPQEIFQRDDRIRLIDGSFAFHYTVGRFAREILARSTRSRMNYWTLNAAIKFLEISITPSGENFRPALNARDGNMGRTGRSALPLRN